MFKFCGLNLKNNIFLAPMAGYTDAAFRSICCGFGAALTFSEMVSAKGLFYGGKNTKELLLTHESEEIKAVQLFGNDCEVFEKILQFEELEKFDVIDLNMGCPARKIIKNCEGSALMGNVLQAAKLIGTCRKNTDKVLSVKFRLGIDEKRKNHAEFAKICESSGADFITVHGRFASQMYSGKADREAVAEVVSAVKIPVVANGDIDGTESLEDMKKIAGAAAYMIGRAAVGNPFIFAELTGNIIEKNISGTICRHLKLMKEFYGEKYAVANIKKHISRYLKGISKHARLEFFKLSTVEDMVGFIVSK